MKIVAVPAAPTAPAASAAPSAASGVRAKTAPTAKAAPVPKPEAVSPTGKKAGRKKKSLLARLMGW